MAMTLLLHCNDLDQTRQFYQSLPGFNVFDTAAGTLTVEKDGAELIFTQEDLWTTPPTLSGTIYFAVADADGYFASIQGNVNVAWQIQNMPYGSREFGIRDCNGYHLAFRQWF